MNRRGPSSAIGGYTLVELLVVLAVTAVLATLAAPMAEVAAQRDKERELKRALWQIRDAIDAYHDARKRGVIRGPASTSEWPPHLDSLAEPWPDARPGHEGEVVRFLRRVPRDPFADPLVPAARTWGLRSYRSNWSDPQPGDDVYDVYSRSAGVGLNGTALGQW